MRIPVPTTVYGDKEVEVLSRDWRRTRQRMPYRKTYLLKPGQHWRDAPETANQWEHYVQQPFEVFPAGAMVAREMISDGAIVAVWTECYGRGRCVLMSDSLVCVDFDQIGELGALLLAVRESNDERWAGLPDAIGLFSNGRVAMRDAKVANKDKVSLTQHAFARAAHSVLGERLDLAVIEWGRHAVE
jgi:hypothetical protein